MNDMVLYLFGYFKIAVGAVVLVSGAIDVLLEIIRR